jgi:superfamily II DNA/RNA helicase
LADDVGVDALSANIQTHLNQTCFGLHGDMMQGDRDKVLSSFRHAIPTTITTTDPMPATCPRVLVATDIASRGLDIHHLQVVINYVCHFIGGIEFRTRLKMLMRTYIG